MMVGKPLLVVFVLFASSRGSKAATFGERLYCYSCIDASSNEECNKQPLELCEANQNSCQTEVRTDRANPWSTPSLRITKRCKQDLACTSNMLQNDKKGWLTTQCNNNPIERTSVCRYCCSDTSVRGCNRELPVPGTICPLLTSPTNGALQCANDAATNQRVCTVACNPGYFVSDITARVITCQASGQWSSKVPTCDLQDIGRSLDSRTCPILKPIKNAVVSCQEECGELLCKADTACTVQCQDGYVINGPEETTCKLDKGGVTARWNRDLTTTECIAITCTPFLVPNGTVDCRGVNGEGDYGSLCRISCLYGYELQGPSVRICSKTGDWTDDIPTCTATCPTLINPANGVLQCTDGNALMSECTLSCNAGYVADGLPTKAMCQADKEWTASLPSCTAVNCGNPATLLNGRIDCLDKGNGEFSFEAQCALSCNDGFKLIGEPSIQCMDLGQWSNLAYDCQAITCDAPSLDNGLYSCNGPYGNHSYLSTCDPACNPGYDLVPSYTAKLECDRDGKWAGNQAMCKAITCEPLPTPKDSTMVCSRPLGPNMYQSVCSIYCNTGFVREGPASTTCIAANKWSSVLPVCLAVLCSKPDNLENGELKCTGGLKQYSYGETCKAVCNSGYQLQGSAARRCGEDGKWSGTAPTCVVKQCQPLMRPSSGRLVCVEPNGPIAVGATCTLACDRGYYPEGILAKTCLENTTWSDEAYAFACKALNCAPPTIRNGRFVCNRAYSLLSRCFALCDEGYVVKGSNSIRCEPTGRWGGNLPVCTVTECPKPDAPLEGEIECSTYKGKYAPQSTCQAKCKGGFKPSGSNLIKCGPTGRWTGGPLKCERATCDLPSKPTNGYYDCRKDPRAENSYSFCTLRCNRGYNVKGNPIRNCGDDGKWTEDPVCEANKCPDLQDPANGKLVYYGEKDKVFGSYYRVVCDQRYSLIRGSEERKCMDDGSWDGTAALCARHCNPLPTPSNGSVICVNVTGGLGNKEYTSACQVTCEEGYLVTGQEVRVCYTSGQWSGQEATCLAACPILRAPKNGRITCRGDEPLSEQMSCEVTCLDGYRLYGDSVRVCQRDGTWSGQEASCSTACGAVPKIANGDTKCVGTNGLGPYSYQATCEIKCLTGFNAVGTIFRTTCQADGSWSYTDAICERISCPPLKQPNDGAMVCSPSSLPDGTFKPGSECRTICNSKPASSGWLQKRTCSDAGTWTGQDATCPVDCRWSWSPWSACGFTGRRSRRRIVLISAKNGGKSCPTDLIAYEQCCTIQYRTFLNSCFTFHCDNQTWISAAENCRKTGGNLAKVDTISKQQYLKSVLEEKSLPGMWIGLSMKNGQYSWTDGSSLGAFSKWFALTGIQVQPDNYRNVENCVKMTSGWPSDSERSSNFDWNDVDCNSHANYICENKSGPCQTVYQ